MTPDDAKKKPVKPFDKANAHPTNDAGKLVRGQKYIVIFQDDEILGPIEFANKDGSFLVFKQELLVYEFENTKTPVPGARYIRVNEWKVERVEDHIDADRWEIV